MKVAFVFLLATVLALPLVAGTAGEFRGTVVEGPEHPDTWVYIEGRNHSIRRVYVNGAKIRYSEDVPPTQRKTPVPKVLPAGTQVRVTAEQDNAGEWHATEIEILQVEAPEKKKPTAPTTSQS